MNCIDFQSEFEVQNGLSQTAELHLADCPDCKKFSSQQPKLWEMLNGLETVEVPKNFDFQLKARIANAESSNEKAGFFPALRYALPLSVIVVLISFIALSGLFFIDNKPPLADKKDELQSPLVAEKSPINSFASNSVAEETSSPENIVLNDESQKLVNKEDNEKPIVIKQTEPVQKAIPVQKDILASGSKEFVPEKPDIITNSNKDEARGSRDTTLGVVKPIIAPEFDTNREIPNKVNPDSANSTDIKKLLSLIGIETPKDKADFEVKFVTKNSLAERSGIMVGDVIEAINGKAVKNEPLQGEKNDIGSLTVLRNGEKKQILLQNKEK